MILEKRNWFWLLLLNCMLNGAVNSASTVTVLNQNNQNWTSMESESITGNFDLIEINVSDNNITEVNSTMFVNHRSLETLIMSRNEFFCFKPNVVFISSNSLQRFECVSCGITVVYTESFSDLPKLKEINLSQNRISSLESGAFAKAHMLKSINLDFNQLRSIPSDLLSSKSIVECKLTMSHNVDFDFVANEVLLKSKALTEFFCNNCSITVTYAETFSELPNLKNVSLNNNHLSAINSKTFSKNPNLLELRLEANDLKEFPARIFDDVWKLTTLCADNNPFESNSNNNAFKKYYVKSKLRNNCTDIDAKEFFENRLLDWKAPSTSTTNRGDAELIVSTTTESSQNSTSTSDDTAVTKNKGISDAFIASYLLIILVAQAAVIGALVMYWFKIILTDKVDEFDYSSNVLNDHDIYDVS